MAELGPDLAPPALVEPEGSTPDPAELSAAVDRAMAPPELVEPSAPSTDAAETDAAVERALELPAAQEAPVIPPPPEGTPLVQPQPDRLVYNPASAAAIARERIIQGQALATRLTPPSPGTPVEVFKPPTDAR